MADRVTYIDSAGEKKTGVLADYQAAAQEQTAANTGKTRVAGGSILPATQQGLHKTSQGKETYIASQTPTAAGQAVGSAVPAQSTGGAEQPTTQQPTTQQQYQNAAAVLAAQQQYNAEAAERARQRTAESIQYQMSNNNDQIDRQNQQAYLDYVRNQRVMPEQLNALGITGGLAESSLVKLGAGYGSLVNENELARRQAMSALYEQQAQQDYQTGETQRAADLAAQQQYYAQQQKEQEAAAELGAQIGDFSGYVTLGLMTEEQAALQKAAWIKKNKGLAKALGYISGGSGKKSGGSGTSTTVDDKGFGDLSTGAQEIVNNFKANETAQAGAGYKYLDTVLKASTTGSGNKSQADYDSAVKWMNNAK